MTTVHQDDDKHRTSGLAWGKQQLGGTARRNRLAGQAVKSGATAPTALLKAKVAIALHNQPPHFQLITPPHRAFEAVPSRA